MNDDFGAFLAGPAVTEPATASGTLSGKTFAAKDVFDVAGRTTGNGQPIWLATHPPAARHAAAVQLLLDSGASLVGKTVCDEMCYSLAGDNVHYGAPANPAAPQHSVGGSSSGSAAAVAGGLADFALGTDCGGSVRCPASFSGLYGIRPTHGRVPDGGVVALAASFDVVGWFARDPSLFGAIGDILLHDNARAVSPRTALLAEDAFARLPVDERRMAEAAARSLAEVLGLRTESVHIAPEGLDRWFDAFRHLQALEIWKTHSAWITEHRPVFGHGVKERFAFAATLTERHGEEHQPVRDAARTRLDELVGSGDALLVIPTAPCSPRRDAGEAEVDAFRARTMGLTCPAGLSGFPQVSIPLAAASTPLGISLLGPPGSDEVLLALSAAAAEDRAST